MIVMQRITQITSTLNTVNVQLLQTSAANIQNINTLKYVALDALSRQLVDLMQRHTEPSTCSRWNAKSSQISSDVNATIKAKICVFGFVPLPVPGTQEVSISCVSHMAGAESESIMGIWEWSPQWGQHAEPLVSGSLKLKTICQLEAWMRPQICSLLRYFQTFKAFSNLRKQPSRPILLFYYCDYASFLAPKRRQWSL